jgi:MFS family permease
MGTLFRPRSLQPDPRVSEEGLERGKRYIVQDAAWASLVGALYGGVILTGFALELGASPFIIGLLAAIPFLMQVMQLPAIVLIERLRQRRKVAVIVVSAARLVILSLALLPFLGKPALQLSLLVGAQVLITFFGAFAGCAVNSWLHQLLANQPIGQLFAQRLFWSTVLAALGALAAGQLIEHWPFGERLHAYSASFAAAGIAGFVGVVFLARVPEPVMRDTGPAKPLFALLASPFRDANFRRVIVFMGSWNFAANLAAPFLTVYLLQQLGYGLGTVTSLWAAGQVANALTLFLWGKLSDRLTNKGILAVALPAWFASLIALPVSALPDVHGLTLPILYLIHVAMGMANAGIGLATGNLGLKLAPQGQGTAFLATVTLVGAFAGGIASLLGGVLATWFEARELIFVIQWYSPTRAAQFTALEFAHWEFLFGLSFVAGMYVIHALTRIAEGEEVSERTVMQQFAWEAARAFEQMSSMTMATLAAIFPFGRLFDRRRRNRATSAS